VYSHKRKKNVEGKISWVIRSQVHKYIIVIKRISFTWTNQQQGIIRFK
jgi:hypothetical protein